MTTTTTLVSCPGLCGQESCGELVAAHGLGDWSATTVTVDACAKLLAQGWVGPQEILRQSQAARLLPEQTVLRYKDGLVAFG